MLETAGVTQLAESLPSKQVVAGSNPTEPTFEGESSTLEALEVGASIQVEVN